MTGRRGVSGSRGATDGRRLKKQREEPKPRNPQGSTSRSNEGVEFAYPGGVTNEWIEKHGDKWQEDVRRMQRYEQQRRRHEEERQQLIAEAKKQSKAMEEEKRLEAFNQAREHHISDDEEENPEIADTTQAAKNAAGILACMKGSNERSVDDTSSEEEEEEFTPSATEDGTEVPTLRRENATLGASLKGKEPWHHDDDEAEEMVDIGTQTEPEPLTEVQQSALIPI